MLVCPQWHNFAGQGCLQQTVVLVKKREKDKKQTNKQAKKKTNREKQGCVTV